jgi:ABC-type branched-subunit amino acid transport system ATPase component
MKRKSLIAIALASMETGQVVLEGPAHELSDNPAVMATYLGGKKTKQ